MNTMNSRERMLAVLKGQTPDRVPVMEIFIDPKVINAICPGMSYEDFIDYADMDAVTCLTMADAPEDTNWVDRSKGLWRDKWGALQQVTGEIISLVLPPARIEDEADLAGYDPPDPSHAPVLKYVRQLVKRFKGKRVIVEVGEDCFAHAQYLRSGLADLMMDFALRPEFVQKLIRFGVEYHVELYRKLIDEGVEVILLGDDYAGKQGTFMSPKHFEKFILPGLATIVQAIKDAGGFTIKHTDGDIWRIMDSLTSIGINVLGPLEPAYVRLEEVRRYSHGRVGVMGNVDVDLLSRGTVEEVRAATRELLGRMSPWGGHILSSGNSISSSVRGENFMAMLETARAFGRE